MENEPTEQTNQASKPPRRRHGRLFILLIIAILIIAAAAAFFLYTTMTSNTKKDDTKTEKILTVEDLNDPSVQLNAETSDVSVQNITKQLKTRINKQIDDNQNPFENVNQLAIILSNTTSQTRQNQASDFVKDFLDQHEDALSFSSEYGGKPDQAQINYWKSELYALLVDNYRSVMNRKFTGSDGKAVDTTTDQLKYINLYLEIAQNKSNWGEPQIANDGHTWYYYTYELTEDFVGQREQLEKSQTGSSQ